MVPSDAEGLLQKELKEILRGELRSAASPMGEGMYQWLFWKLQKVARLAW